MRCKPTLMSDLLACLKGAHPDVPASQCLLKLVQRYINDQQNWAVNIKTLIIIHRCLQDKDLSQVIAKELKPKAHILTPYTPKKDGDGKMNQRIVAVISQQYVDYVTKLLKFISKTSLLSKKVSEAPKYVKKLATNDIFLVYDEFEKFITIIMQVFENKEFCRKTRLF